MLHLKKSHTLALGLLSISMLSVSHSVWAHTSIQFAADEGKTSYNNFVIGHACHDASDKAFPVTGQSVMFPTGTQVTYNDGTGEKIGSLSDFTNKTSLKNLPQLIQSKDIFSKQDEKTDGSDVIGFISSKGKLETNLHGIVPFRFGSVSIKPESCAKSLIVKVAIVDICKKTFPAKPGTAEFWLPYSDELATALTALGSTAEEDNAATLVINRTSALPESCGNGYDVTITPSADDIAKLPQKGVWGK